MRPALRHQVAQLDRTLLALVEERARLAASSKGAPVLLEDLLRRSTGPLPAESLREIFAAIERA